MLAKTLRNKSLFEVPGSSEFCKLLIIIGRLSKDEERFKKLPKSPAMISQMAKKFLYNS